MANEDHIRILQQGVEVWNSWIYESIRLDSCLEDMDSSIVHPDLSGADLPDANLSGAQLMGANLSWANLVEVDLSEADVVEANLSGANLSGANLEKANLSDVNFYRANLSGASLSHSNLYKADLSWTDLSYAYLGNASVSHATLYRADLSGANCSSANFIWTNLIHSTLTGTDLKKSKLKHCWVYGVSAWDLQISEETDQSDLIVNRREEDPIYVDDIEVAQLVYLLLDNKKLRNVIETITSKAVLILGRFTPERKLVLEAVRKKLRDFGYLPILFDFDRPNSRDFTETVAILARLARFIVADITEPRSIPKELEAVVTDVAIPVVSLIESSDRPYGMFRDYWKYGWVLETHNYNDLQDLLMSFNDNVVAPAEAKLFELEKARLRALDR